LGKDHLLIPLYDLPSDEKQEALHRFLQLIDDPAGWHRIRSLKIESWNDQPVRHSEIASYLKILGFRDAFKVMALKRWM